MGSNSIETSSFGFTLKIFPYVLSLLFAVATLVFLILIAKALARKGTNPKLRLIVKVRYFLLFLIFIPQYAHEILTIYDRNANKG